MDSTNLHGNAEAIGRAAEPDSYEAKPRGLRLPRFVARSLFVVFALCPLLGTAAWATWRHVTLGTEDYQAWLGARLGLEVTLSQVTHATPSADRLDQAELLDPETGHLLARLKDVTIRTSPERITITGASLLAPRDRLLALWRLLHDRAMRERRLLQRPIELQIDHVLLSSPSGQSELVDWRLKIERRPDGSFAEGAFTEQRDGAAPVEFFVSRQEQDSAWKTEVDLLTESSVKVDALLGDSAWTRALGDDVTFRGNVRVNWTAEGWSCDLAGTLDRLQLGRLLDARFPHRLVGTARATIRKLEVSRSTIRHLEGQLDCSSGQVSHSLLVAATEFLGMQLQQPVSSELVDFDQLAMLFAIDNSGMTIRGTCGDPTSGTVLAANRQPLLSESPEQPQYTFSLIQALANERSSRIFWTEACKPLLNLLPPPS